MFIINNDKIKLTRGDTADFKVVITDLSGKPYEVAATDVITMTVKKSPSAAALLTLTADSQQYISFSNATTAGKACGLYMYDIELVTQDGRHYTIIQSYFELLEEVGL